MPPVLNYQNGIRKMEIEKLQTSTTSNFRSNKKEENEQQLPWKPMKGKEDNIINQIRTKMRKTIDENKNS